MTRYLMMVCVLSAVPPAVGQVCAPNAPSEGLASLGAGMYKTLTGGLYSGGETDRPAEHEAAGLAIAQSVQPLDTSGSADPEGRIVLISIGFSNMTQEWAAGAVSEPASRNLTFTAKALRLQATGQINPKLLIVDGAKAGMSVEKWAATPIDPSTDPWRHALDRIAAAGSSRFQVQVACVKVAHPRPTDCIADDGSTTGDAGAVAADSAQTARNLKIAFPNLKIAYCISRTYGGYALSDLNPEPFAYESGFGVKWLIEAQITGSGALGNLNFDADDGPVAAPWLSWGPYLWANGLQPNHRGICWAPEDFRDDDRTHPASGGVDKVGTALVQFFMNDSTTRPWFRGSCGLPGDSDDDCDVDGEDVSAFAACAGGPELPLPAGCAYVDLDGDGDGDQADFSVLQRNLSELPVPDGPACGGT